MMWPGHTQLIARARHLFGNRVTLAQDFEAKSYLPTVLARIKDECFIVEPGVMRLSPFTPRDWPPPDVEQVAIGPPAPAVFSPLSAFYDSIPVFALVVKKHDLHIKCEITEPGPPRPKRYDRSGRWKRFPPSRRRRMKSWRFAPEHSKRHYAPLAGRCAIPWWAQHPDAHRLTPRHRLGDAVVMQRIYVYAQEGAPTKELLAQHSMEWRSEVVGWLR